MCWLPFLLLLAREDAAYTFSKYADAAQAQHALLRCRLAQRAAERANVLARLRHEHVWQTDCRIGSAQLGMLAELR